MNPQQPDANQTQAAYPSASATPVPEAAPRLPAAPDPLPPPQPLQQQPTPPPMPAAPQPQATAQPVAMAPESVPQPTAPVNQPAGNGNSEEQLQNVPTYPPHLAPAPPANSPVNLPRRENGPQLPTQQQPMSAEVLRQGAEQAQEVLFEAKTVFPFILFPDKITIDRVKVTLTQQIFFGHTKVQSAQIEDLLNTTASCGPFFGQVSVWTRFFADRPLMIIKYLNRHDALRVKRILQGYTIARHQKIATANLPKDQLVELLLKLGEASTEKE